MITAKRAAGLVTIGLVSGCGQASAELEPGLYEQHVQTEVTINRPGRAPEVQQGPMETQRLCIEQVVPDRLQTFLALPGEQDCTFDKAVWAEGKADIAGTCLAGDGGPPFKTSVTGTYLRAAFDVTLRMTAEVPEAAVDTNIHITARRVGDCPAKHGG